MLCTYYERFNYAKEGQDGWNRDFFMSGLDSLGDLNNE